MFGLGMIGCGFEKFRNCFVIIMNCIIFNFLMKFMLNLIQNKVFLLFFINEFLSEFINLIVENITFLFGSYFYI